MLRAFLVEDEILIAVLLEDMLAGLGHEAAATAGTFEQALEMAERERFDLAILDVNVNGRQIYPVAEILERRGIPFAFSTGYGRQSLREHYRNRPILRKPIDPCELEQVVSELMTPKGP